MDYIETHCEKCKNRLNDKDLCEIRKRTDGTEHCINYEEEE